MLITLTCKDFDRLVVSIEKTYPIQVVCNYLYALASDRINAQDLHFTGDKANVNALGWPDCVNLIKKYFKQEDMSFTTLNMFIDFFSDQLVKFTRSQFFTVDNLSAMVGVGNHIRRILVEVLLQVSIDFAHRATEVGAQQVSISYLTYLI